MRKGLVAVIAVAIMILALVPFVDGGSDGANAPDTGGFTIKGYVKEGGALFNNDDAYMVLIIRGTETGEVKQSVEITNGYFEFTNVPLGVAYYISLNCPKYSIEYTPGKYISEYSTTISSDIAYQIINWPTPSNNTYQITGSADGTQCIGVYSTYGKITGTVTEGSYRISGARVDILGKDTDNMISTAFTKNGTFTITNCPTGTYDVKVTMEGYETYETEITVLPDPVINTIYVQMVSAPSGGIMGIDLPHFLMIVGGVIAGILVIVSVVYRVRMRKDRIPVVYDDDEKQ
ncbi:MAG: carboxypeptidase-like regulatory domain-containing protein [Candidatus Methanomethylophilaceae archaeon]